MTGTYPRTWGGTDRQRREAGMSGVIGGTITKSSSGWKPTGGTIAKSGGTGYSAEKAFYESIPSPVRHVTQEIAKAVVSILPTSQNRVDGSLLPPPVDGGMLSRNSALGSPPDEGGGIGGLLILGIIGYMVLK